MQETIDLITSVMDKNACNCMGNTRLPEYHHKSCPFRALALARDDLLTQKKLIEEKEEMISRAAQLVDFYQSHFKEVN